MSWLILERGEQHGVEMTFQLLGPHK
jgi:hypothetical protein